MTFFEWVAEEGQTGVARALGEGFHVVRVHRAFHAHSGVDEELIARCEEVLGQKFERARTLDEWWRRRRGRVGHDTIPDPMITPPSDAA